MYVYIYHVRRDDDRVIGRAKYCQGVGLGRTEPESAVWFGEVGEMVDRVALLKSFPHPVVDAFQVCRVHADVEEFADHA